METLKGFYNDYKNESYLTEVLESLVGLDMSLLEKASMQTLRHLRELCRGKEEVMVQVLQLFMSLPGARERWDQEKINRRVDNRKRDQDERQMKEKLYKKISKTIKEASKLNPRIDPDKLEPTAHEMVNEVLSEDWPVLGNRSPTGKPLFNRIIGLIFVLCRRLSEPSEKKNHAIHGLIVKILASFKIRNSKGKNYSIRDIHRFVKERLPSA